ncbi:MAG: SDR family oxidoreductase [Pseudomonadota bacterium]
MTRVAIVTGAAKGIGRAVAHQLASEGWQIVCADIDQDENEITAAGTNGHAVACDIGKQSDVNALVQEVVDRFGRLDGMVSNAGINQYKPLDEWTLEHWDRIIATNLTANFLLAKAAEKHLRQAKGSMVLMASSRAQMSEPGTFAYSASKGGIVALTHSLAISLQPDVRVNCILPGWIDTGKHGPIEQIDHDQHPVGRVGQPEDIAEMVSFLLSDQRAGFITGQEFVVDGGMTKKMIYV